MVKLFLPKNQQPSFLHKIYSLMRVLWRIFSATISPTPLHCCLWQEEAEAFFSPVGYNKNRLVSYLAEVDWRRQKRFFLFVGTKLVSYLGRGWQEETEVIFPLLVRTKTGWFPTWLRLTGRDRSVLFLFFGTKLVSYGDEVDRRRQELFFSYWLEQKRFLTGMRLTGGGRSFAFPIGWNKNGYLPWERLTGGSRSVAFPIGWE